MEFVRINGVTLHYRFIAAPAGRPTLVFANSLGTDFRIWTGLTTRLAGDFAMVAYDKRGHGLSELGDAAPTIATHVADLAGLLDHLRVKRAILCGLSVGGLIAQGLYASRPDLIEAMILCDTAHKIGTPEIWNGRIDAAGKAGIDSFADGVMEKWFTPEFHKERADELAGYRTMLVRQSPAGYQAVCAAIRDADFTRAAGSIAVPTLCVVGEHDGSTPPELVRSMADLIPGARFEIIAGAGHIPCVEQPDGLAALIRGFVGGVMAGTAPHN